MVKRIQDPPLLLSPPPRHSPAFTFHSFLPPPATSSSAASVPMISRRNPCLYCVFFALLSFHLAEGFSGSLSCLPISSRHETALNSVEPAEKSYGKGAWKPPSQNKEQQRGNIFSIQQPQDLLDFVVEDERLSVGEFESEFHVHRNETRCTKQTNQILSLFPYFERPTYLQSKYLPHGAKRAKCLTCVIAN
eukprot:scaffold4879_cov71-Cyclotella_meneghiniana.AAC.6